MGYINGINTIALIKDELLFKMDTKRLLNIKRKLGGLKRRCIIKCDCGCDEIEDVIQPNYDIYKKQEEFVKSILDTREHVERK